VESLEFDLQKQNERYWNSMEFHGISVSLDCIYRLRVPMESMLTNTWSDRSNGIPWNSIGILKSSGFQGGCVWDCEALPHAPHKYVEAPCGDKIR
jgi:hypothetical protein